MERPNKGLALAALVAGMSRATVGATASMMAFRDAITGQSSGPSRGNSIGPGRGSISTMHAKIRANAERETDGAQRMRDIVAERASNWRRKR